MHFSLHVHVDIKLKLHVLLILLTATESRTFLLYYTPILYGILPHKFLAHALLLSKATRILLSDGLSPRDISLSEQLFWSLTERYYG